MKNTYTNGILNIAASSAANSSYGLFQRRDPHLEISPRLDVPNYSTCVLHKTMEDLSESITGGPLASRGWVLQEWLLSPRVVHFGKQLFWECPEMLSCETLPLGSPDRRLVAEPGFFKLKKRISSLLPTPHYRLDSSQPNANIYRAWRKLCQEYSRRDLSVGSDKIIALLGIADLFQSVLQDTYMTGLWKSTFVSDMCWLSLYMKTVRSPLDVEKKEYTKRSVRPPEYGAPSWSWMSVDHEVNWYQRSKESHELAVVCWINHSSSVEELRSQEKVVTLRGVLRPARWKFIGESVVGENQFQISLDGNKAFHSTGQFDAYYESPQAEIMLDDLVAQTFPDEEIFFLPLLATFLISHGRTITGIILCQAGESQYRRVGCFNLFEAGVFASLFFEQRAPASILKKPWKYFLEYAERNRTVEQSELLKDLFGKDKSDASQTDRLHKGQVWQVQEIQHALGPYNKSMFQPLAAREIRVV
jgi:hypothetical protein